MLLEWRPRRAYHFAFKHAIWRGFDLSHIAGRFEAALEIGVGIGIEVGFSIDTGVISIQSHGPTVVWNADIDCDPDSDSDSDGFPQYPRTGGAIEVLRIGPEARVAQQHRVSLWQK